MAGSSVLRVKQQLIELMQVQFPDASFEPPTVASDVFGSDGSGKAVWWDDTAADGEFSEPVFVGPGHVWQDEVAHATLVLQVIGRDTDDTQEVVDGEAEDLFAFARSAMVGDPTLGIASDSEVQVRTVLPKRWTYSGGITQASQRAVRIAVEVEINARVLS